MVLELHVWGPAFALPSIDPQCLAAVAYTARTLPRDQWVLIASSDAGWSPTKDLPALKDEDLVLGGLQNIIDHLHQRSDGEWDLDHNFNNPKERADITAFSSHILTHLYPLLSLSLYVSSENYSTTTRPAYTLILPWPTQYYIPPSHRQAAKTRTEHLNLSSLDLDNIDNDERQRKRLADVVPERFRSSTQSVTGLVREKRSGTRFRCGALVDAACGPLQQLLGEKKYLLSNEHPSSLDCLALAYLALASKPDMPQKWLQEGIRNRYPALYAFVEKGIQECFGGEVSVKDAKLNELAEQTFEIRTKLPWRSPSQRGLQAAGSTVFHSINSGLPFSNSTGWSATTMNEESSLSESAADSVLLPTIVAASTAVAAAAGYLFYSSLNAEPEKASLQDMGEAGAIFSGLDFGDEQRRESVAGRQGSVPTEGDEGDRL